METIRCKLFKINRNDYEDVRALYTDNTVRQFLGGVVDEKTYKTKFGKMCKIDNKDLYWTIRKKDNNQFVGLISLDIHHNGLDTEISYQLLPKWWGQGLGAEVVNYIINYGFNELGLKKIVAETQSLNIASCKLLERAGMRLEENIERFGTMQSIFVIKST